MTALEEDPDAAFAPYRPPSYNWLEQNAKPVVCELCAGGRHRECVRPCRCEHR